jgi:hypothetical protein
VGLLGAFLRTEELRGFPKHSTTFFAVFVAVKRTESTRTFLYIQLSQQISIYSGTDAHATPCRWALKSFCFHEPDVPLLNEVFEGKTLPAILSGDGDGQSQVLLDEPIRLFSAASLRDLP